jgi:hypothetical protein
MVAGSSFPRLNFWRNVELRADLYVIHRSLVWNGKEVDKAIPRVMSASRVTNTGETSEGSTAAKLEVARPKSPTAHIVRFTPEA